MIHLLLLFAFTVGFTALAWWRMRFAIAMLLFALPSYLIRFDIGPIPMTVLEVMLLAVTGVTAMRLLQHRIPNPIFPWRWLVLFFLLTGVVAVLVSPDTRQALGLYKAYMVEPVLFFLVLANTMRDRQGIRIILWAFGMSTLVIGYIAIAQQLHLLPIPAHYGLETPPRATAFFPFPTAVGKFLGPIVALFIGLLIAHGAEQGRKRLESLFFFGIAFFGVLGLVLSVSRGAIVGVLAAAVFAGLFTARRKLLAILLGALVVVALLVPVVRMNVMHVVQGKDTSTDVHLIMWKGALRIIQDHPVSGTGLASFPIVYDLYRDPAHVELFPNPDQFVLTIWIELGFAGILVFLWFFGKYAAACRRLLAREKPLAVGLLSAMVALLVHGLVDTPYFKNDLAVVFWTLAACVVILEHITKGEEHNTASR